MQGDSFQSLSFLTYEISLKWHSRSWEYFALQMAAKNMSFLKMISNNCKEIQHLSIDKEMELCLWMYI